MIYTITLNPAFDQTINCENFTLNSLNRIKDVRVDIGGKGINVSKVLQVLEQESLSCGFLGEENANEFISNLNQLGLLNDFLILKNQKTRTNIKIIDPLNNHLTEINESGFQISLNDIKNLAKKLSPIINKHDFIVFSGSLPLGADPSLYTYLIVKLQQKTDKIILDLSGESLKQGLSYKPLMIKPNLVELEELVSKQFYSKDEILKACQELLKHGVQNILLSLGEHGSFFFNINESFHIKPISTTVKSPVGAGDSQVAAFVYGLANAMALTEILALTSAVSTAMVSTEGTTVPNLEMIKSFLLKVKINRINLKYK